MAIVPIPGAVRVTGRTGIILPQEPVETPRCPEPCTVVIFGAAGDLVMRKLMPSLFHLARGNHLPENINIVGVDRAAFDNDSYRAEVAKGNVRAPGLQTMILPNPKDWGEFLKNVTYFKADLSDPTAVGALKGYLEQLEAQKQIPAKRLFLSGAAAERFFRRAAENAAGIDDRPRRSCRPRSPSTWARVIIEKPFGRDLDSARKLNALTASMLKEDETYRIDHYLGKETVQNTLFFRFANGIFEPLWNYKYIESVQITAFEPLGVEKRGSYYEESGAIRDMIQNHLMQVLALVTMEAPGSFDAESIRDEKVKVLKALRPIAPENACTETIPRPVRHRPHRPQRKSLPTGRNRTSNPTRTPKPTSPCAPSSTTGAGAGVPIYLRSGKRIVQQDTEVVIQFRRPPYNVFKALKTPPSPNQLILQIQPNDGITLNFEAKVPGSDAHVKTVSMDFSCTPAAFTVENPSAYERLLVDAMIGDQTLFLSAATKSRSAWKFITPILQGWQQTPPQVLPVQMRLVGSRRSRHVDRKRDGLRMA